MPTLDPITPAAAGESVTPHDTNNIDPTKGVYVGTSGDLKVNMLDGTALTFVGIAAGMIHPLTVTRVYSTGTTASDIIALR